MAIVAMFEKWCAIFSPERNCDSMKRMTAWTEPGEVHPRRLVKARLELHRAAQIVAAVRS